MTTELALHTETALIYCRVSDRKQLLGSGLDSQEHRCRQIAAMRNQIVEKAFLESASGGLHINERPALQEMLRYLDQQKYSGKNYIVYFDDHKRFARQTEQHLRLKREFASLGVRVEYLNFTVEDTPEGAFIDTMLAAQAQLEREQIGRQTRQKTKARLEKGFWTFRAPVGYKYIQSKHGGKELIKDEPLASIVKEALEGFASGRFATQTEMQRFLENNPHYPKDLPDGRLRPQTVVRLMSKVVYAGYVEAPSHKVSRRKGQHEGIISLETFEAIQARRKENTYLPARKDIHQDFVLRGAVCCHACEKPLRSSWSKGKYKKYAYYLCQTKGCTEYGKSIPRDELESAFESTLETIQPPKGMFKMVAAIFKRAWDIQTTQTRQTLDAFKREARDTEKEITSLIERIMEASSPRVIQAYEQRIDILEKQKLIAQEKAAKPPPQKERFEKMLELSLLLLANPCKIWELGQFEVKRTVLKLAFPSPIYYDRNAGARTPLKAAVNKAFLPFSGGVLQNGAAGEN